MLLGVCRPFPCWWHFQSFLQLHVNQLIDQSVEKSRFYIYLINVEVIVRCNGKQDSEAHPLDHGCKRLIDVNTKLLQIASHYPSGLERGNGTIDVSFHLKDPFPRERSVTRFETLSFRSKSNRCDRANEICVFKLIRPLCSFLGRAIVVFCCFRSFAAIAYAFIVAIPNVMICQVFSSSCEVEISESFVPYCDGKFVALCLMYFWLSILVDIVFNFQEDIG